VGDVHTGAVDDDSRVHEPVGAGEVGENPRAVSDL